MIKSVRARNFLSWAELDFPMSPGVTLIEGWNHDDETPEGSGKSAILNAIAWALYGGIPKDAKTDDVIREGQKGCEVEIEFESGWKVVRARRPNDLYLWSPITKDKVKGKDAKETQTLVEQLVGMSFETFCQSIYFAQNYQAKFVTANEAEKAKILSEIQDLSVFDRARKEAMTRIKTLEAEEFSTAAQERQLEQGVKDLIAKIEDFEKLRSKFHADRNAAIESLEFKLKRLATDKKALVDRLAAETTPDADKQLEGIRADLRTLTDARAELKSELSKFDEVSERAKTLRDRILWKRRELKGKEEEPGRIQKLLEEKNSDITAARKEQETLSLALDQAIEAMDNPKKDKCPTCKQDWDGDPAHYEKEVAVAKTNLTRAEKLTKSLAKDAVDLQARFFKAETAVTEAKRDIAEFETELGKIKIPDTQTLEKDLKELTATLEALREAETALEEAKRREAKLIREIETIESQMKMVQDLVVEEEAKTSAHFDEKITQATKEALARTDKLAEARGTLQAIKNLIAEMTLLKDGFKEVKSFVFKNLLDELTRKANRYLGELFEQPVKITFTNEGEAGELSKILVHVTIDGQARPLGLYSGGQFRRIQLAVDLALSDIVTERGDRPLKLLVLDEYFKDLSEVSMEKALKLLEGRKGSVLLVEHNSLFKSIVQNSFRVELVDGVSRRA